MDVDGACRGLRQRPVCREPSRPVRSGEPPLGWAAAVPLVSDTAYPRLEPAPSPAEVGHFTPTLAEIAFIHRRTRQPGPRLALLVLLKTFQRLGYFIPLGQVPTPVVEHVAIHVPGLASPGDALAGYETSTYRSRLTGLVRDFVGVSAFGRRAHHVAQAASVEAAHAREDVADIINAAIEELVRQRFELPAFGTLVKLATAARATVNRGYHRRIADALPVGVRQRLNALLVLPPGQARTAWDRVKTEPKRPTPRNMRDFLRHLDWLRGARCRHRGVHDHPDRQGPLLCRRGADPDRQRYGRDGRAEAAGADGGAAPGPDRPDA